MKLHELKEARAARVAEMRALSDKAEAENRDLTADEAKTFDGLKAKIAELDAKIGRAQTLEDLERAAPAIVREHGDGQFEERVARDYSVVRAMRLSAGGDLAQGVDAGFEREAHAEVVRRTGREFQGIAVPDEVFLAPRPATDQRTLLVGSSAADLVPNVHRPDLFIDRLRARLVTGRLGATVFDGLVGTVDIPRQTGSSTAQWVDEDGDLSETDASFDDVTLAPKTVGAMTSYSRRTLLNSAPAIEQIVRSDLAAILARAIDAQAMIGDGQANRPTGIVNAGAAQITAATLTWDVVLSFIAALQAADADMGSLGWALNPYLQKMLRATTKVASDAGAGFLMDRPNELAGYAAAVTSALPGAPGSPDEPATAIFGDWSALLIGYWSGVDILVNPYEGTAYAKGRVLVRAMRDVDVQVRHAESFAFASDAPVSPSE